MKNVLVYCGSSNRCPDQYLHSAEKLGRLLAQNGMTVVYGGGAIGSMGRLASGTLSGGGKVVGFMPKFMCDVEWAHPEITELRITETMHDRKAGMLEAADAVVALPGGCGTFEELFEAITMKRLGIFLGPIVLVNINGFYDPCLQLLEKCVAENFMDTRHTRMWSVVSDSDQVLEALASAEEWSSSAIEFATQK